jgi:hypothetical protein
VNRLLKGYFTVAQDAALRCQWAVLMSLRADRYRERAAEAKDRAAQEKTPSIKSAYEEVARSWLLLAEEMEWTERRGSSRRDEDMSRRARERSGRQSVVRGERGPRGPRLQLQKVSEVQRELKSQRIFACPRAAERGPRIFPPPGTLAMGNAVSRSRGRKRVALAQQLAAHRQLQQPEAEPSGPLKVVDVMLVLKLGGLGKWAKSSALLSCGVAFGTVL